MEAATISELPLPSLVPGLPLIGNAWAMANNLIPFIVEQYKRQGPIFRVRALNQEMVVLAGPEANAFVTQEGADKLSSYEVWYAYGHEFGVDAQIQNIDGEPHQRMRKLLKNAYSV
jgi:cytochrome P450